MIIPNDNKPKPGEISAWTVATGIIKFHKRRSRQAVEFIKNLEGFIGIHPAGDRGTLWLFDTKKNAMQARNAMDEKGIVTGDNIVEVFIPQIYKEKMQDFCRKGVQE